MTKYDSKESDIVIRVILIEDDENECEEYKKITEIMDDIEIVAITNSSTDALKQVKRCNPDAVILDLELNKGEGSGIEFIQNLNNLKLSKNPKIVVTTNIYSDSVYTYLHKNEIEFIFYKNQANYSRESVLNTIRLLINYNKADTLKTADVENPDCEDKIADLINKELDLIGVSTHLKGRKYLFDAIEYIINNRENGEGISVIQYLVNKYKRVSSTISRAMQNAILHAWRISAIEDLTELYTARINYETGVPTPTEFIYYYADKIKKMI